jgi:hypothetical protein
MNDVHGMETQMFTTLRSLIKRINTASAAEVEGMALLARIDGEVVDMQLAIGQAETQAGGLAEAALLTMAKARLNVLKEAAIAARALRPEHIRYSGAMACLRQGAVFAPMAGQAAVQLMARVA